MLVPGFWTLLGVLLLFHWVYLVGVVRAEFLRGRNFEYITAARALGLSNVKIMFKHLLPNAMVATLTFLPFKLSGSITALTALDFLGLGLPPGSPSLGELLAQGKANLQAPWLGLDRASSRSPGCSACSSSSARACATRSTRARPSGEGATMRPCAPSSKSATCRCGSRAGRRRGRRRQARLLHDRQGRDVALVGESGSGKTVSALSILRLLPYPSASHPAGEIYFGGKDLLKAPGRSHARASAARRSRSSSRSR